MFSVQQKRDIANAVQKILRDTRHPELPVGEIQFKLYVHGRFQWSWANIQNNAAVLNPSVNPWNEAQDKATPAEDRYGRGPEHGTFVCELPGKVKSLAQYLAEYIDHEHEHGKGYAACFIDSYPDGSVTFDMCCLEAVLKQALDAYESTENVKIRIERV